jgi:hypothetical protein
MPQPNGVKIGCMRGLLVRDWPLDGTHHPDIVPTSQAKLALSLIDEIMASNGQKFTFAWGNLHVGHPEPAATRIARLNLECY